MKTNSTIQRRHQERRLLPVTGLLAILVLAFNCYGSTIAYWNFEDGVNGQAFTPAGQANGSGGSVDTVSGVLMRGWDLTYGPSWTNYTYGTGLGMNNVSQDGYVLEGALHNWGPTSWTIECMVFLRDISGWRTLIGRDGTAGGGADGSASDFYLQKNGVDNKFRINFKTAGGNTWILDGDYVPVVNKWYALAVESDGVTLSMWLDDGSGYTQIGNLDILGYTPEANAITNTAINWTFGRGWYGGNQADRINGMMDNIRFSDVALTPGEFIKFPTDVFIFSGPTPANQTVALGSPASISAVAGGNTPSYQWRHNGTAIPGATTTTYTILAVTSGDAGNYDVVVTNSSSSVTSSVAVLNIHEPRVLAWAGVGSAWDTTAANWTMDNGASTLAYIETDNVRFDPLGASQPLVTLNAAHVPSSVTVSDASYILSGAPINSAGALVLQNNATLVLSNASSFAGGTTVNGILHLRAAGNSLGALSVTSGSTVHLYGNSQTASDLSGGGLITSTNGNPVLTFGSAGVTSTWSGMITTNGGNPSFIKVGAGTSTFSGSNYMGGTAASQVNGGALIVPSGGAIVPQGTAELWVGQGATTGRVEVAGGYIGVNNWLAIGRANAAANGTMVINSGTVRKTGSGNVVLGSLGATGELIVNGGQLLNNANLYLGENGGENGTLRLNGGLVQATRVSSLGAAPASSTAYFNGGTLQASAASPDFIPATTTVLIQSGGLVFDNNGFDVTIAGFLAEDPSSTGGGITKLGAGTLTLSGALAGYNHTGPTVVRGGTLSLNPASGLLLTSPALVVSNAALSVAAGGYVSLNATDVTLGDGAVLNLNYGTLTGGNPTWPAIAASGSLAASGATITINISGYGWSIGTFPLITYGGASLGGIANFMLGPLPPGMTANLENNGNSLDLHVSGNGQNLSWYGDVNNVWDLNSTANWANSGVPGAVYLEYGPTGDPVRFDDTAAGNYSINLPGNVHPFSVVVDAANNYSFAGAGGITGAASLAKANAGSLHLGTVNSYTGGTIIAGGLVTVAGDSSLGASGGAVTMAGGTLELGGVTSARPMNVTAASTVSIGSGSSTLSGMISGSGALTKSGIGTLTISGTSTNQAGPLQVAEGTVALTGSVRPTDMWVGTAAGNTTMGISGNITATTLHVGNVAGAVSAVRQTGGTVISAGGVGDKLSIGQAGSYGYFDTSGGSLTTDGICIAGGVFPTEWPPQGPGDGLLEIHGVNVTNTGWITMARGAGPNNAVLNIFSGSLTFAGGGFGCNWSGNGTAGGVQTSIINVMGGSISSTGQGVDFRTAVGGTYTNVGILNLKAGVLSATGVGGAGIVNFDGGALQAATNSATFLNVSRGVYVYGGSATIDDNGYAIGTAVALLAPTGSGVHGASITDGGAGYIAPPIVTITGDGEGAAAIAEINPTSGRVTNVVITSPGVNYTYTTFTVTGGGATTPAVITGATPTANASGGLTKVGSGTAALGGANTYTGLTMVSSGTLNVNGSIAGAVTVQAGATLGGIGTIAGVVTVEDGATLGAGTRIGTLTLGASPSLVTGSTIVAELNRNDGVTTLADRINVTGALSYNGTLVLKNVGEPLQVGDKFTVFNASGGYSGLVTVVSDTPGQQITWDTTQLAVDGSVAVSSITSESFSLGVTVSGNTLSFSWPTSMLGARLETNAVSVADPASWFTYPGSGSLTGVDLTIDSSKTNVFFRLVNP